MSLPPDLLERLPRALHPLSAPPSGPGWNYTELVDVLPDPTIALRPAAVLIGLIDRSTGPHVVLTRRTEALRHHGGQISFPGGRIEPTDINPIAAALREAHEEIGLLPEQVTAVGYLDPFATITGFHVFPIAAYLSTEFLARPDPAEVEEIFEVPLAFLVDPNNAQRFQVTYAGGKRELIEFHYRHYRIWGATAAMLVNLRERLEQTQ